ncbi:hypothetical protein CDAR_171431 [Caerostris darwini]|uniref:Uncharacterized protein n=1 Tax=Caerostris darwini TaxID=1538125 RepID=A0AAV4WPR6_9ARAC|nr:hypothetical protein CDAR_171431 [Caerostris darwini]
MLMEVKEDYWQQLVAASATLFLVWGIRRVGDIPLFPFFRFYLGTVVKCRSLVSEARCSYEANWPSRATSKRAFNVLKTVLNENGIFSGWNNPSKHSIRNPQKQVGCFAKFFKGSPSPFI